MIETASRWPLPSPPPEPVLTLVLASDAAEASTWIDRFVIEHAAQEPQHLCAFWTPDPTARRFEIVALAPASTWVDQR